MLVRIFLSAFILIVRNISLGVLWHNYKLNTRKPNGCNVTVNTARLSDEEINKWKLWPNLQPYSTDYGEVLYGFREAMDVIWKNQHPANCKDAKFLISEGWTQGFGSEVHVVGVGLAIALNMNRVYMMNPKGPRKSEDRDNRWQTHNKYCKNRNIFTLECYYEPWTNCSYEDALGNRTFDSLRVYKETYFSDTDIIQQQLFTQLHATTIILENRGDVPHILPKVFENMIKCSPIINIYYWWRTISATYQLRPNRYTLKMISKYRTLNISYDKEVCIGLYIRRGDKHVEAPHVSLKKYFEAISLVTTLGVGPDTGPTSYSPNIVFVGSEDQDVIDDVIEWGKKNRYRVLYTNLFDRRNVSAGLNFTQQKQQRETKDGLIHHDLEYFSMLLNLDNILKCDSFVCTQSSNFCRVIDELRVTVGAKINAHYYDLTSNGLDRNFYIGW